MSNIKNELLHGVFWSAVEKYSGLLVSIIVSMVLARILSPSDYGVVAIASVLIQFLQIFCTMGIAPAIIQNKDLTDVDLDNIYSFSIYVGIFLSAAMFSASWGIAHFYSNQNLVLIVQLLTINLFFSAANMVPNALMAKNKRFKDIARRTLTLQILTGGISIVSAYCGLGMYSLLISPIITSIGIFFYNKKFFVLNFRFRCGIGSIKKIFSYSIYQLAFEFSNYFSRNLDKLIIGKYLTVSELGYYEKSYRLMQLPLNNVSSVINPVIQPVMSGLQDDKYTLSKQYLKIVSAIAMISFPISCMLFVSSNEIISLMYGDQWLPAANTFMILSLSIPTQMILATSGAIWQTCNCTKQMFWTGLINTSITVSGFFIASYYGGTIESIALSWTITSIINFFNTYIYMYKIIFKSSFGDFLIVLRYPIIAFLIVIVLYYLIPLPFTSALLSLVLKVIILILIISVVYRLGGLNIFKLLNLRHHERL